MKFFRRFRRDHSALERAKQADVDADKRLRNARDNAAWAQRTLAVDHLADRFYTIIGGKP